MSDFKKAVDRGRQAAEEASQQAAKERADRKDAEARYRGQARNWLIEVVLSNLEQAKTDVAGDVTIDIDTSELDAPGEDNPNPYTPSVGFRIYRTPRSRELMDMLFKPTTFNVSINRDDGTVWANGGPQLASKSVGNIADKSGERFREWVIALIEDAVKPPYLY